jgi:hypothetical protein
LWLALLLLGCVQALSQLHPIRSHFEPRELVRRLRAIVGLAAAFLGILAALMGAAIPFQVGTKRTLRLPARRMGLQLHTNNAAERFGLV